ncbi:MULTISPECIES: hypothetical protein [unclassified Streptomyces]|uniref:hypothetical protein n=1 Tax=unclassified Streptomyces TaxID=2593676 RepID=UPI0036AEC59B
MGKKQTRVNKGARTGGHEHRTAAAEKERSRTTPTREAPRPSIDQPAHRKEPKFGHN